MINDEADQVIEKLFESLLNTYQNNLEKLIKISDLVLSYVHLLYYKYHEINQNCGRSYIHSPDWVKNKRKQQYILSTKKIINAVTVALNYEKQENILK